MQHAMWAGVIAILATVLAGNPLLAELRRRKYGKDSDPDQPEAYASKAGTPTMGGVIILAGVLVAALSMAVTRDADTLLPLGAMIVAALLGGVDDFRTLIGAPKVDAHATGFWLVKWVVTVGIGVVVVLVVYLHLDLDEAVVPHFGAYSLGAIYVPVAVTVGLLGGYFGSYFQAVTVYHATAPGTFTHFNWASQNLTDNLQAYLNMGSMAMFIVIVSCF